MKNVFVVSCEEKKEKEFLKCLEKYGFNIYPKLQFQKHFEGCDALIELDNKMCYRGGYAIGMFHYHGKHAVTINEFWRLYFTYSGYTSLENEVYNEIFEKYKGKKFFDFN